jgi:TusA-related sulfurtransferase
MSPLLIKTISLNGLKRGSILEVTEDPMMLTLNLLGYHCPVPVHETRKALDGMEKGTTLEVIADDAETKHDIPLLLERIEARLISIVEDSGEFTFIIEKQ